MYTRREWDKHEITGNLAVGTKVTSETVEAQSCRIEENAFMNTAHKAVFLEAEDMSKEGKKHANKPNINNWKFSPQWEETKEDLKIYWTRWQETVETIAIKAGENVDASCYHRKDTILQDMLKTQNNETSGTKHKNGTGHGGKKRRENKSGEDEDSWNGNMLKTL